MSNVLYHKLDENGELIKIMNTAREFTTSKNQQIFQFQELGFDREEETNFKSYFRHFHILRLDGVNFIFIILYQFIY